MLEFSFPRNTKSIKEIHDDFVSSKLFIDNSYQRRKVWLEKDMVRLIETIIMGLIVPEIYLWPSKTDPNTGNTINHIVDGQQRINAIIDFVCGEYKLVRSHLIEKNIKEEFGDKFFHQLPDDIKSAIWGYKLSIVEIDKRCTKDDIIKLFNRLNLTEYNLNNQEKRNTLYSEFGKQSLKLSQETFWKDISFFSSVDIRRMRDVEYCSSIILLVREGIVDQTRTEKMNQIYQDLQEEYPDKEQDYLKIKLAMEMINKLLNSDTCSFINKKTQMYSLFSVVFDLIDNKIELCSSIIDKFDAFVKAYNSFKNEIELSFDDPNKRHIYEYIKRYKLASSEGVNKLANRMIRFEVLKKLFLNEQQEVIDILNKIKQELVNTAGL